MLKPKKGDLSEKNIGTIPELKVKSNYQPPGRAGLAGTGAWILSALSFLPPFSVSVKAMASSSLTHFLYISGTEVPLELPFYVQVGHFSKAETFINFFL